MHKTLTLISMLRTCSRRESSMNAANTDAFGFSGQIDSPYIIPGIIAVLSALVGFYVGTAGILAFLDAGIVSVFLGTVVLAITFFFSFKGIVSSMYFSNDLPSLLSLPLTDTQVAFAKVANVAERQVILSACAVVPFAAAFTICRGANALFLVAAALELLLVPIFALSVAGIVIVLALRFIGFARNRNLLRFIGAALMIAITVACIFIGTEVKKATGQDIATSLVLTLIALAPALQSWTSVVGFLSEFAATGNALPLLFAVLITAACLAVFTLVTKAFYFDGALAMQDSGKTHKPLDAEGIRAALKPKSAASALAWRDVKTVLRDPDLLVNSALGSLMTTLFVIFFGAIMVFGSGDSFSDPCNAACLAFCLAGITAGFNSVRDNPALTAFSREGKSFELTSSLPLSPKNLMMGKRNASLILSILTSMLPLILFMLVGAIAGKLNPIAILFVPGVFIGVGIIVIDIQIMKDAKYPSFVWVSKRYLKDMDFSILIAPLVSIVVFVAFGLGMIAIMDATHMPIISVGLCIALTVAILAMGKASDARLIKQGPVLLGLMPS